MASTRSEVESSTTSAATVHTVALPPTVSAGDRIVVVMSFDLNGSGLGVPNAAEILGAGWVNDAFTNNGTIAHLVAFSKTADGSEANGELEVETSSAYVGNFVAKAVQDWSSYAVSTPATGTSATPDLPSVTFSWGNTEETYFLGFAGNERSFSGGSAPTDFGNYGENLTADNGLRWADRTATIASPYNPGAFGAIASSDQWITVLYAFESSGAASVPATATPATITAAATMPAATVDATAAATAQPAAIAASAAMPAASVLAGTGAAATPDPVAASTTMPAPTLEATTPATPEPAAIDVATTMPAAAAETTGAATPTPNPIAVATTLPAPTVVAAGAATAQPAAIVVAATLPEPALVTAGNVAATPDAINVTATMPTPTVEGGATATPAAIVAATTMPTPTVETGVPATAAPATIDVTVLMPTPAIEAGAVATPNPISVVVTLPAPVVVLAMPPNDTGTVVAGSVAGSTVGDPDRARTTGDHRSGYTRISGASGTTR